MHYTVKRNQILFIPKDIELELSYIKKAKDDRRFFAPLYEKYYKQIFFFVFKKVQDESITGDLTSKTFLKAMLNIDKFQYKGFPFSSWLYRIASNEVNMFFRESKKAILVEVLEKDIISIVNEFEETQEADLTIVLSLLEKLPNEQKELIELRFFDELSFKEIADIYEISEANAKMKVYRILSKLEKEIKNTKA